MLSDLKFCLYLFLKYVIATFKDSQDYYKDPFKMQNLWKGRIYETKLCWYNATWPCSRAERIALIWGRISEERILFACGLGRGSVGYQNWFINLESGENHQHLVQILCYLYISKIGPYFSLWLQSSNSAVTLVRTINCSNLIVFRIIQREMGDFNARKALLGMEQWYGTFLMTSRSP